MTNPIGTIYQIIVDFAASPSTALVTWQPLLFVFAYGATFAVMGTPIYAAVAGAAASVALPLALGLAGIAQAYDIPVDEPAPAVVDPPADQPSVVAMPGTPAGATVPTAPPAPAPTASATAPAPPPTPAPNGVESVGYAVRGDGPGFGFGPSMRNSAVAVAPALDSASAAAAAAALASSHGKSRARKRRGAAARERGYRYEFMTMDDGLASKGLATPSRDREKAVTTASSQGTGTRGFTATTTRSTAAGPGGLTRLAGDSFGRSASIPMLPGSWVADDDEGEEPRD